MHREAMSMSARTYSLTVVGDAPPQAREKETDLHPAAGILAGVGLSLVFWVALALILI